MITQCPDELPNPHKNCVREILSALVVHDNDIVRINAEIRELRQELKRAIENIEIKCAQLRNTDGENRMLDFTKQVAKIDDLNECFTTRIKRLLKLRDEKITEAKKCLHELNIEKCKFKKFHERTIDYFKRLAITSDDPKVIKNCEKDIGEMHKRFVKEVLFIKKTESELKSFFKMLKDDELGSFCECCCFKDYDWVPKGNDLGGIDAVATDIKNTIGKTLTGAFSQMHVHQPSDPRSFLANYLINVDKNEMVIKQKLDLFRNT